MKATYIVTSKSLRSHLVWACKEGIFRLSVHFIGLRFVESQVENECVPMAARGLIPVDYLHET
jgi:hypothetical protein